MAVERTLAEADVILTTLSSSLTSPLERYLVQGQGLGTSKSVGYMRPVSVCIKIVLEFQPILSAQRAKP